VTRAARSAGRFLAAIAAGAAVSLPVYALTGRAGVAVGTSIVSATTVSHVHYRLNDTEPSRIDALAFSLTPALPGGDVAVRAGAGTYRCRVSRAGTRAVCATTSPQLGVRELTALSVIAAQ
jgi:hypothetical protein